MVFSSPFFLFCFLPVAALIGLGLRKPSFANPFLLLASLYFYASGGLRFMPWLLAMVGVNFASGLALDRLGEARARQALLAATVALDTGVLVHAKYNAFLVENLDTLLGFAGLHGFAIPQAVLPLGISFFTFHLLSYVIDVYRGTVRAQRNVIDFALYICFFPQLIAGPIIRYHDVESQLRGREVSFAKIASGLERFILGMAKKVLLANAFGAPADRIFALPADDLLPATAWAGLILYALQLYFDFSGYSDMAIGLGRIFGFEYLENFNYPFISRSISEFWRRWHISLSNWFRDYMYMPMVLAAARRRAAAGIRGKIDDRPYLALVFTLCGIWHGANWTFLVWGSIHGVFLAAERGRFGRWLAGAPRPLQHLYVLSVILLAWVFFRAPSIGVAGHFLASLAGLNATRPDALPLASFLDPQILTLLPLGLVGLTPSFSWLARDWRGRALQSFGSIASDAGGQAGWERALAWARPPVLLCLLAASAIMVSGQSYNPFIYFRF